LAYTLVHVSDLHFHRLPLHPRDWDAKRCLGALNLVLNRRRHFPPARAEALVRLLDGMDWEHLVITGDLTQLGLEAEFALARQVLAPLLARGPARVTVLPGNHDRYGAAPGRRDLFAAYFGEFFGEGEIATRRLTPRWALAAWDSSRPTRPFDASGTVRPATLAATEAWLAGLPAGTRAIVANHYPVHLPPPHRPRPGHDLENAGAVADWLRAHPVHLYLHGHRHHNWVLRVPGGLRPLIVVNSAASTQRPRPGERSAFHRIVLDDDGAEVQPLALP